MKGNIPSFQCQKKSKVLCVSGTEQLSAVARERVDSGSRKNNLAVNWGFTLSIRKVEFSFLKSVVLCSQTLPTQSLQTLYVKSLEYAFY